MKHKSVYPIFASILFVITALLMLNACQDSGKNNGKYEKISQEEAKNIMDTKSGYLLLDVRTDEEFAAGHIPGAILIPDYEISKRAKTELTDKSQLILVYCRSGRRSKQAASQLVSLGYTNVKDFGGINDWKYDIVNND